MQTASFFLGSCTTLVSILSVLPSFASAASSTTSSSYTLQTTYAGSTFFNGFNFYSDADPTHGFVTYVNQSTAQSMGLISASDGNPVYIGVDHTNTYNGNANYYGINGVGRPSVRIESMATYNHALIIADITNMPGGVCGTWPALWTLGDGTWPYHGEIDIIEGVNSNAQTLTSLHTAGECIVPGSSAQSMETGTVQTTNCTYDVNTGTNSAGCGVLDGDTKSFGLNFNSMKGGVYAMEWTSSAIKTWFFERGSIPSDITAGTPKPSGWGNPYVDFAGDCNIDANFINHRIVLDNTFCGDWSGSVWGDTCQASTGVSSCSVYVGNNPSAFQNMYWSINSIKVYQTTSAVSTTTSTTSTTLSTMSRTTSAAATTSSITTTSSKSSSTTSAIITSSSTSTTSLAVSSSALTTTSAAATSTTTSAKPSTTLSTTMTTSLRSSTATSTSSSITSTSSSLRTTSSTTSSSSTSSRTSSTTTSRRRFGHRAVETGGEVMDHSYQPIRRGELSHRHLHERRRSRSAIQAVET